MNNHMEARRRQMFMERVCAARRRLESQQTQENQEGASSAFTSQSEPLLSSDGGPSKTARFVNIWIQPEKLRRDYDHSRNGPVRDQTWHSLERELNSRERCLSSSKLPSFNFY
ncbi:hypothetical protein Btru_046304 [Bulinus truncatus]|nr:hypothetical protein Btru_046304 [Bulinus truncatus]